MADEIPSEYSAFYKKTTKRPKGILFILSFLVIILIGIFVGLRFFSIDSFIASITKNEISSTPTKTPEPTMTPEPTTEEIKRSVTPSPSEKKGVPTSTTKVGIDKLDRALLTVDVQNGSGEAGAAKKIANVLISLGYKTGTVGNADTFDYTGITIQVKSTKANYLEQLKKDLSENYTVFSATKDLPSSSTADALVIYGKNE